MVRESLRVMRLAYCHLTLLIRLHQRLPAMMVIAMARPIAEFLGTYLQISSVGLDGLSIATLPVLAVGKVA